MLEAARFVYCPRCGKTDIEVYKVKGMRCTECGYIYFHNTAAAVAGIIEMDGGVLLTVRAQEPGKGRFDLPGGFADYHESIEGTLLREIGEELGIEAAIKGYLGSFPNTYVFRRVEYFTCDMVFVCSTTASIQAITCSQEIERCEVTAVDRLSPDGFAFPSVAAALREYAGKINRPDSL
jgi:NAD+ diphosphatase